MAGRFKLDENLPHDAETLLNEAGHDVETVLTEGLGGSSDPAVYETSKLEDRILVTLDLDFADIRLYPPSSHPGIWVLRPGSQNIENILSRLRGALRLWTTETATNRLWIVEHSRVRIHE
jgi:predicted nuclease of predicted toxin-antitoxin system